MATKEQKEFAENFFNENPQIKVLYLNKRGEVFTDINYLTNSLLKDKDGKLEEYETIKRGAENQKQEAPGSENQQQEE